MLPCKTQTGENLKILTLFCEFSHLFYCTISNLNGYIERRFWTFFSDSYTRNSKMVLGSCVFFLYEGKMVIQCKM